MDIEIQAPNTIDFQLGNIGGGAVYSVNGKVGDVVLDYEDVGALSEDTELFSGDYDDLTNKPTIPTKTSEIINDSGYITSTYHDSSKQDVIADLATIRSNAYLGSTAVQPAAISDMATKTWTEAQGYLTEHQSLVAYRTSAAQDVIDTTKVNRSELSAVATSGNYNDLTNRPTIPVVPTNVSAFNNDAGYLTSHQSLSAYRTSADQDIIDAGKQGTLTAGANITIENNVISATGSGVPEIAWFDYSTATLNDVMTAVNAGKEVIVIEAMMGFRFVYALVQYSANNSEAIFQSINGNNGVDSLGIMVAKLDSEGWTKWSGRIVPAPPSDNKTYVLTSNNLNLSWVEWS